MTAKASKSVRIERMDLKTLSFNCIYSLPKSIRPFD